MRHISDKNIIYVAITVTFLSLQSLLTGLISLICRYSLVTNFGTMIQTYKPNSSTKHN